MRLPATWLPRHLRLNFCFRFAFFHFCHSSDLDLVLTTTSNVVFRRLTKDVCSRALRALRFVRKLFTSQLTAVA